LWIEKGIRYNKRTGIKKMEKIRFLTSLIFTNIIYYGTIIFSAVIWYYTKIFELGFIFVPFIICTVYYSIKTTKEMYIEYNMVKKLNKFSTIDEGLKHLGIAKNLVNEFNKNGDVLYATRIDLICRKVIEKKLYSMGWEGDKNEKIYIDEK
jgi:hypothetical protein